MTVVTSSSRLKLKHPIVLVHGVGARDRFGPIDYFFKIPAWLEAAGNRVYAARLPSLHTIDERSRHLKEQILREFPEEKVNLVGHSMGGLDARFTASRMGISDHIASVTTIGTPNHGSSISDIALGLMSDIGKDRIEAVLQMMGQSYKGYEQLVPRHMQEVFNVEVTNAPGVGYFYATTQIRNPLRTALPLFWLPHRYILKTEGENDGFVSLESAKWGELLISDFGDHYAQIGHPIGFSRGLDLFHFYETIVTKLHHAGM